MQSSHSGLAVNPKNVSRRHRSQQGHDLQSVCNGDHNYAQTRSTTVSLLSLNVCGLKSKVDLGIVQKRVSNCDFVCLSETKVNDIDTNWFPNFVAFTAKKCSRTSSFGGIHGVAVLIKAHIASHVRVIDDLLSECVLWLHVNERAYHRAFIIGAVYIPHEQSCHFNDSVFDNIMHDLTPLLWIFYVPFSVRSSGE